MWLNARATSLILSFQFLVTSKHQGHFQTSRAINYWCLRVSFACRLMESIRSSIYVVVMRKGNRSSGFSCVVHSSPVYIIYFTRSACSCSIPTAAAAALLLSTAATLQSQLHTYRQLLLHTYPTCHTTRYPLCPVWQY